MSLQGFPFVEEGVANSIRHPANIQSERSEQNERSELKTAGGLGAL